MEERPALLVGAMILAFVIAIGIASRFGGPNSVSSSGESTAKTPVKKFRAKPGTARENARALVSDVPSATESKVNPSRSREAKRREVWNPPEEERARSVIGAEVARAVDAGLSAASVGEGIAHLRDRLAESDSPQGRSSLYGALGLLYAREGNLEEMREAFRMAGSTSLSDAERVESLYEHAQALLEIGRPREVLDVVARGRLDELTLSTRRLQLRLLAGFAHEELGEYDAAASVYEDVMARVSGAGGEDLEGVYRQAGLRATRVFTASGKKKDAARIRRVMKNRVNS